MKTIDLDRIDRFVLKKQHLSEDSKIDDIVRITRDIGGLHGTSGTGPYLSLYARSRNFKKSALAFELSKKKSLARLRYVRNTIYILPQELIPVAFAATSRMSGLTAERYSKYLGITPRYYERTANKILKVLKGRGLTVKEIRKKLKLSVNITPIVNLMCDKGLLVRGLPREGWKSTLHTYYLWEDYFPCLDLTAHEEEEAREIVLRQYLSSFGPVSEKDISWWTGFPVTQVRRILDHLSGEILPVEVHGFGECFFLPSADLDALKSFKEQERSEVNVLPALDPYLMGYKHRERYIDSTHYNWVFDRSGNATSSILVDGRVVGVWDLEDTVVKVFIFKKVSEVVFEEICSKTLEIGTFILETRVHAKVCDSMIPLNRKSAGAFMSPLKDR